MQFAKSRTVVTPDVEAASDAEWKTASERAAAMERLVAYGAGPEKITEVSEQLGLSKAMIDRKVSNRAGRVMLVVNCLIPWCLHAGLQRHRFRCTTEDETSNQGFR